MPKYINATALLKAENNDYWEKYTDGGTVEADDIIHIALAKILRAAPAEDVVSVVRCKDCKYRTKDTQWTRAGYCGRRGAGDFFAAPPDGYCSYGERKEKDDES